MAKKSSPDVEEAPAEQRCGGAQEHVSDGGRRATALSPPWPRARARGSIPRQLSPLWRGRRSASRRSTTAEAAKLTAFTTTIPPAGPADRRNAAATRRARGEAQVGDRAVERGRGRHAAGLVHEARERGERRRREQPVPIPASRANATVASKLPTSATPPKATALITSAITVHQRRDQRSAAAPTTGPSSIAGTTSASSTRLTAHGESKRS